MIIVDTPENQRKLDKLAEALADLDVQAERTRQNLIAAGLSDPGIRNGHGERVILATGGPPMEVVHSNNGSALCAWEAEPENGKRCVQFQVFPNASLRPVGPGTRMTS